MNTKCFASVVVAFYIIITALSQRPKYRHDYIYEKSVATFYKLHTTPATWHDAFRRCISEGADLLVPDTLDECDKVPVLATQLLLKHSGVFLGVHDLYTEKRYVTVNGSLMSETILNLIWEHEEPKHKGGRCVAMRRTGRLFLHPCDKLLPFICKKPLANIKYYEHCTTFDPRWKLGPNGKCYYLGLEPQTWFHAYGSCISSGGQLAIITNETETDHIRNLFKKVPRKREPNDDFAFLGYNDLFTRHHFRDIHGKPLATTVIMGWEKPDSSIVDDCDKKKEKRIAIEYQRCVGIHRSGYITAENCNVPHTYVCDKPAKIKNVTWSHQ